MSVEKQKQQEKIASPKEAQLMGQAIAQREKLVRNLVNVCLFVPQAFLSRTPELTPPEQDGEDAYQTFARRLQTLHADKETGIQLVSGATEALQQLYVAINQEAAVIAPVTAADWVTINTRLFEGTMAKIQTQPQWVRDTLRAPLTEREEKVKVQE